MRKKIFGQTGLEISVLGFGCMRLPLTEAQDPTSIDYDLATTMLHQAINQGVNYVDTAYPYHGTSREKPGESELFLAQALRKGYREKVYLTTKLPTWLLQNKKQMHNILDEQLKRLDTHFVDFYLAHNLNNLIWPKVKEIGMIKFFDEAIKDGRIKYAGFSFHDNYALFEEIAQSYDWGLGQIQYNYLDVDYQAGQQGAKLAHQRRLALVIMEPLRGGFLIKHLPPHLKEILAEIRPQWSLADWGLRWLWNQPEPDVVLSGMSTLAQVEENLHIADHHETFTEDDFEAIKQVREYFQANLKANCTNCGYCSPCPEGVAIPKILCFYNDYFLADHEEVRDKAKYFFKIQVPPPESFSNCIHCGQCEEKCPQHLPISDLMTQAATVLV